MTSPATMKPSQAPTPRPDRLIRAGELMGMVGIARLTGVKVDTVRHWRWRNADFPEPVAVIDGWFPLYVLPEILDWLVDTGRLKREDL